MRPKRCAYIAVVPRYRTVKLCKPLGEVPSFLDLHPSYHYDVSEGVNAGKCIELKLSDNLVGDRLFRLRPQLCFGYASATAGLQKELGN